MPRESYIQSTCAKRLRERGAYGNVNHGSAFSGTGRPDWEGCYKGFYIAFEFKTPKGRLRPEQVAHIHAIRKAGGEAYVATCLQHVEDVLDALDGDIAAVK